MRIIEISSHLGARPKCAKDQGKLYDLDNGSGYVKDGNGNKLKYEPWSSSSYGEPDGILGINCGHHAYPFAAGKSTQIYFPYDEEENDKLYRKIQKQRELERRVRASKRACSALKDGDPEMFKKASVQLKQRSQALKDYCTANDLTYQNERTSVLGYGRSEAGKVTAAYNKHLREKEIELESIKLVGVTTSTGVNVTEVSAHIRERMLQRDFSTDNIQDALTNPLDVGKIREDRTQQFIGEKSTVAINVDTGKLTTGWKTSSKKAEKLKKKKEDGSNV